MGDQDDSKEQLIKELAALRRRVVELEHREASLQQSDARFRAMVDAFDGMLYICSPAYKIEFANERFMDWIGHDPVGEACFNAIHGRKEECPWCVNERVIRGETVRRTVQSPKDQRWYYVVSAPVTRPDGDRSQMAMIQDITHRKLAADVLRESEEKYRDLFETAGDAIYTHDLDGNFTSANRAAELLIGADRERLLSMNVRDVLDDSEHRPIPAEQLDTKVPDRAELKRPCEIRLRRLDGTERWVEVTTSLLVRGEHVEGIQGHARDITDRKRAEEALRQSEEKFRDLVELLPEPIFEMDTRTTLTFVSSKGLELFGFDRQDLDERLKGYQFIASADRDRARRNMQRILQGEYIGGREYTARRKDGTTFPVFVHSVPIRRGGSIAGIRGILVDLTERKQAEQALRESEERLRLAWETSPDAFSISRLDDGTYIDVNKGYTALTGYQREEVIGRSALDIPFWHRAPDRQVMVAGLQRDGYIRNLEAEIRRKDGEIRTVMISAGLMMLDGGPHLLALTKDIEDVKRAQEAVAKSERLFRTYFELGPVGMALTSPTKGWLYVNDRMCEMLGYTREELLQLTWDELTHPDDLETDRSQFNRLVSGELVSYSLDKRFIRKDGQAIQTTLHVSCIRHPDGSLEHLIAHLHDISDRKRAEDQLKRLFTAVEQAGEAIIMTDRTGTILYVNPAFEMTTGFTREEALGRNPRILKSGHHDDQFYDAMWQTISSGNVWRGEFTNRKKDATLYEAKATISPIKDDKNDIVNHVAVIRDVTGEKTLQKQLLQAQKMEAIGTLAGGIAHDFNNLLMIILGYTDLLMQHEPAGGTRRDKLAAIRQAARDGADLVNRILTFSRRVESKVRPIDLNDEVLRIERLMLRTLPKMITIELHLANDLNTINADPAQMEQMLLNLAVNAHHAMPDGGRLVIETSNVTLREDYCKVHAEARPGKYVLLAVSDTGTGIEPEILDRIFEPFFTTKANGEGTGLGLSMVHGIVAQHTGYIRCYSEPGVGTTFKIYFPIAESEIVADMSETMEMPAFGSETILLVDDDKRIRELGAEMMMLAGYDVLTATSGHDALEIYQNRKEEISLVILDLIMPGMSGSQCLKELLKQDPDVKVLICSGYSTGGPTKEITKAGARGFITKPYDTKEILKAIRTVLDKGRLS